MNNLDKAAELILPYIGGCAECDRIGDACLDCVREAKEAAKDVAEAGLLAPDLPEPDHDTRDPKWRAEYEEEYGYSAPDVWCKDPWLSVGVFPGSNEITIWDGGEKLEPFSIAEARKLAYCFLAAANHAEGNNE